MITVITAKILLQSKQDTGDQVMLTFIPDYADGRNKEWAKYTPGLNLTMGVKPEVAEQFRASGKYTLQFIEEDVS